MEQHSGKHRAVHCNRIDGTVSQISGVIANKEHTSASQHTKSTPHFNEEGEVEVVVAVVVEVDVDVVVGQHSGKHDAVHCARIVGTVAQTSGVIRNAKQNWASMHTNSGPHSNVDVVVDVDVLVEVEVEGVVEQHSGKHAAVHWD